MLFVKHAYGCSRTMRITKSEKNKEKNLRKLNQEKI